MTPLTIPNLAAHERGYRTPAGAAVAVGVRRRGAARQGAVVLYVTARAVDDQGQTVFVAGEPLTLPTHAQTIHTKARAEQPTVVADAIQTATDTALAQVDAYMALLADCADIPEMDANG